MLLHHLVEDRPGAGVRSKSNCVARSRSLVRSRSGNTYLVDSFILSNSSIQQTPLSAKTRAPVWSTSCLVWRGRRLVRDYKQGKVGPIQFNCAQFFIWANNPNKTKNGKKRLIKL